MNLEKTDGMSDVLSTWKSCFSSHSWLFMKTRDICHHARLRFRDIYHYMYIFTSSRLSCPNKIRNSFITLLVLNNNKTKRLQPLNYYIIYSVEKYIQKNISRKSINNALHISRESRFCVHTCYTCLFVKNVSHFRKINGKDEETEVVLTRSTLNRGIWDATSTSISSYRCRECVSRRKVFIFHSGAFERERVERCANSPLSSFFFLLNLQSRAAVQYWYILPLRRVCKADKLAPAIASS